MGEEVMPFGRFSPAKGLWVDRTDKSIQITGQMELYGAEATAARAAIIQTTINNTWTKHFPDGYSVTCQITVRLRGTGINTPAAEIETDKISGPSNVNLAFGRKMTLNAKEANAFTWTAAHEFGHVLGLEDKYSESIWSTISGKFGGSRTNTIHPGYERNLMGQNGGFLGSKNIADLASENEPSPYWMNGDDHVRDWVSMRTPAEIRSLSTVIKLRAIKKLMSGWISDDDVKTIEKLCLSVSDRLESQSMQKSINLLDFTSIGQRTQMRVIYTQMP